MQSHCRQPWMRITWGAVLLALLGTLAPDPAWTAPNREGLDWITAVKLLEAEPASDKSVEQLRRFLKAYPQSRYKSVARYALGEVYFQRGNYQDAQSQFQMAVETKPVVTFADSAMFRWGECLLNRGESDKAGKVWGELVKTHPQTHLRPDVELNHVRLLLSERRFPEGDRVLTALVSAYPFARERPEVVTARAALLVATGKYEEALLLLGNTWTPPAVFIRGRLQLLTNHPEQVVALLEEARTRAPEPSALAPSEILLLFDLYLREHYSWLLQGVDQVQSFMPEDYQASLLLLKGHAYLALKSYAQAKTLFREWQKTVATGNEYNYGQYLMGLAAYRNGEKAQAEKWWESIQSSADAVSVSIQLNIADECLLGNDIDEAKRRYEAFIKDHPDSPDLDQAYLRLAQAHYKAGDDRAALRTYRQVVRLSPGKALGLLPNGSPQGGAREGLPLREQQRIQSAAIPSWLDPSLVHSGILEVDRVFAEPLVEQIFRDDPERNARLSPRVAVTSASRHTVSPWLTLITQPPVLVVYPQTYDMPITSWKFAVSKPGGNILYLNQGEGGLPERWVWDGQLPQRGQWIEPGEPFVYSLNLKTANGEIQSTVSQPKRLNSLAFTEQDNLHVDLLSELVFVDTKQASVSALGRSFLKECCDQIIQHMPRVVWVTISGRDPLTNQNQALAVQSFIQQRLGLPAGDIRIKVTAGDGEPAERVSVVCVR